MLSLVVKSSGRYRIIGRDRRGLDELLAPELRSARRVERIIESLRSELVEGGAAESVRIRRIFSDPREIFRLEFEMPELGYQRTTLLDRDTLEELLASEDVRSLLSSQQPL